MKDPLRQAAVDLLAAWPNIVNHPRLDNVEVAALRAAVEAPPKTYENADTFFDEMVGSGFIDEGMHWHQATRADLIEVIERAYLEGWRAKCDRLESLIEATKAER